MQETFDHYLRLLFEEYRHRSSHFTPQLVSLNNSPSYCYQSSEVLVVFIHGFMGTPAEMLPGVQLATGLGYSTLNLLIPGFGADAIVANLFNQNDWKKFLDPVLIKAVTSFKEVHFVGFSTGGLILHSFLRRHSSMKEMSSVRTLNLFSPFYVAYSVFTLLAGQIVGLFSKRLSVQKIYHWTRYPDVKVMIVNPMNYLSEVPILSAFEISRFGREVANLGSQSLDWVDTQVFLSRGDRVLSLRKTRLVTGRDFRRVKFVEFSGRKVPHHLMVPEVSPVAADVWQNMILHITNPSL